MLTRRFWIEAADRAVKTAAQAALLVVLGDAAGFNAVTADWASAGGFAAGGAILSLLTSLVSAPIGDVKGTPSLVK